MRVCHLVLGWCFIFLHGALYFYWKLAKFNKFYSKLICWFSDKKGTDLYLTLFDLIMPIVFYPCLECSSLLVEKEIESIISTYNLYVCMYVCMRVYVGLCDVYSFSQICGS